MATLLKLSQTPLMQRCLWNHMNKVSRTISTTKKNSDSSTSECPPDALNKKPWVSYGFDYESQSEDTVAHHASFFFSVTLCLVFGSFLWAYAPDVNMRDWAQREAYLQIRRREGEGRPVIGPNYIDPSSMKLPKEDEICMEIII